MYPICCGAGKKLEDDAGCWEDHVSHEGLIVKELRWEETDDEGALIFVSLPTPDMSSVVKDVHSARKC